MPRILRQGRVCRTGGALYVALTKELRLLDLDIHDMVNIEADSQKVVLTRREDAEA
jgi:hypothetical protein